MNPDNSDSVPHPQEQNEKITLLNDLSGFIPSVQQDPNPPHRYPDPIVEAIGFLIVFALVFAVLFSLEKIAKSTQSKIKK